MKKFLFALICLSFSAPAFAAPEIDAACKKIESACKNAGYKTGLKKSKKDSGCMNRIMDGQSVENLAVTSEEVAACRDQKASRISKKSNVTEKKKETVKNQPEKIDESKPSGEATTVH